MLIRTLNKLCGGAAEWTGCTKEIMADAWADRYSWITLDAIEKHARERMANK